MLLQKRDKILEMGSQVDKIMFITRIKEPPFQFLLDPRQQSLIYIKHNASNFGILLDV